MVSKPRIIFEDRGKVLALSEEGYSHSQHGSPGVCTIPQGFSVMSPGFVCIGVMEECMSGGWRERNLWKIASNQQ